MDVAKGIPEEFALLRQELARVSGSRFSGGLAHPLEAVLSLAVLGLMCGQCSLSAIYRFGGTPRSCWRDWVSGAAPRWRPGRGCCGW